MSANGLLPVKPPGARKNRLASALDVPARDALVDDMLLHVIETLRRTGILRIVLLSRDPPAVPGVDWIADGGRGLNNELRRADAELATRPLLVMLPDLPLLSVADITTLLAVARQAGAAIAPDRHDRGTNAVAFCTDEFNTLSFGMKSFQRFTAKSSMMRIVRRPGLGIDCDIIDELAIIK